MNAIPRISQAEETGKRVRHRLGIVGLPGFGPVPHLLLLHQTSLGITSDELNVWLNIFMHWHDAGRRPFVHTSTIAKRMGVSQRKVQTLIRSLKRKGLLERVNGMKRSDPDEYDVRPLLLKLERYAKEWITRKGQERLEAEADEALRELSEVLD